MSGRERIVDDQPEALAAVWVDLHSVLIQVGFKRTLVARFPWRGVLAWIDPQSPVAFLKSQIFLMEKLPETFSKTVCERKVVFMHLQMAVSTSCKTFKAKILPYSTWSCRSWGITVILLHLKNLAQSLLPLSDVISQSPKGSLKLPLLGWLIFHLLQEYDLIKVVTEMLGRVALLMDRANQLAQWVFYREASKCVTSVERIPIIDQCVGSTSGIRACALRNFDLRKMELKNSQNNALAKLPMLKLGDPGRQSTRSRSWINIGNSNEKDTLQEEASSSSKGNGKAVLKPNQDKGKGPRIRNHS
ncbi:hypothetical protein Tco_1288452 [Tanacetum coccineum]